MSLVRIVRPSLAGRRGPAAPHHPAFRAASQAENGLAIADCRLKIHGLPIADLGFGLPIGDCRLAIGDWRLAIGDWRLAIGD
jgi:hypothetical protein